LHGVLFLPEADSSTHHEFKIIVTKLSVPKDGRC